MTNKKQIEAVATVSSDPSNWRKEFEDIARRAPKGPEVLTRSLAGEAILKVLRDPTNRKKLEDGALPRPLVYTIAKNIVRDRVRARKYIEQGSEDDTTPEGPASVEESVQITQVEDALAGFACEVPCGPLADEGAAGLPMKQRQEQVIAYSLHLEGCTDDEIGSFLNLEPKTAGNRKRAMAARLSLWIRE